MGINANVRVFTPDGHTMQFGPVIITGWAKGEYIRITPDDDLTMDETGSDGEVAITRKNTRSYNIEVILMQTSVANTELSVFLELTKSAPNMAGAINPFMYKDLFGASVFECDKAWIMRDPDIIGANETKTRTWKFRGLHPKVMIAGSEAV